MLVGGDITFKVIGFNKGSMELLSDVKGGGGEITLEVKYKYYELCKTL